jgi:hypothetical protein
MFSLAAGLGERRVPPIGPDAAAAVLPDCGRLPDTSARAFSGKVDTGFPQKMRQNQKPRGHIGARGGQASSLSNSRARASFPATLAMPRDPK